jgi:hypothetical protein
VRLEEGPLDLVRYVERTSWLTWALHEPFRATIVRPGFLIG